MQENQSKIVVQLCSMETAMKVRVWQQFSSNHSASFTIVGVFDSSERADAARQFLENFFNEMDEWYKANPEEHDKILNGEEIDISEVEQRAAEAHRIEWNEPVLWWWNYKVAVQDNVLVVTTDGHADSGAYPVDVLLNAFGARVAVDHDRIWYEDLRFGTVEIGCVASDAAAAQILQTERGSYEQIEGADGVYLKLDRQHIDWSPLQSSEPGWFESIRVLNHHGCTDIRVAVVDEVTDTDHYGDLYDELRRGK